MGLDDGHVFLFDEMEIKGRSGLNKVEPFTVAMREYFLVRPGREEEWGVSG